jgi:hypothetical protein
VCDVVWCSAVRLTESGGGGVARHVLDLYVGGREVSSKMDIRTYLTNKSNKELNSSVVTTVDRETVECVVQHADVLQVNAASNARNTIVTAEARFNVLHICC